MIELKQEPPAGEYRIRSYQPGAILINETTYDNSLVVSPKLLIDKWKPKSIHELSAQDWQTVIDLEPGLVILGTGPEIVFPDAACLAPLIEHNIGYEVMDTAAACRTFTVLVAEDRRVIAALFP